MFSKKKSFAQYFCSRKEAILSEILLSQHVISHHVSWRLLEGLEYLRDPPVEDTELKDDEVTNEKENVRCEANSKVDNIVLNFGLALSNPIAHYETQCAFKESDSVKCEQGLSKPSEVAKLS